MAGDMRLQESRKPDVVSVEESYERRGTLIKAGIHSGHLPAIRGARDKAEARIT